jgi:hypothetical protein
MAKPNDKEMVVAKPEKFKDPMKLWIEEDETKVEKEPTPIELLINEMLGVNNIEMKTVLTDPLIIGLTKGTIFAKRYNSPIMADLVMTVSKYRISRNGRGRDDIKVMAKGLGGYNMEEQPSFMSRLFKGE